MAFLYADPSTTTYLDPFGAILWLDTDAYFKGVWSMLINIDDGIWYFSTRLKIWWCRMRAASFLGRFGFSGFEVVFTRLTEPILRNGIFVHKKFERSRAFRCSRSLLAMRTFVVAMETTELTGPPFLLIIWRKMQIFSSTDSNIRGLSRFNIPISLSTFGPFFSWSRYFFLLLGFLPIWDEDKTF